jgi:hypothetical protein
MFNDIFVASEVIKIKCYFIAFTLVEKSRRFNL